MKHSETSTNKIHLNTLTFDERRTYQSLVARGVDQEDAYQDALDGIHVHDVRYEYKTK